MTIKDFDLHNTDRVKAYLRHSIADLSAREEFYAYLDAALVRFLTTMEFLPDRAGHVLEIGATPYFLTILMQRFRPYTLELSNFFQTTTADARIVYPVVIDNFDSAEHYEWTYRQFNVEMQAFPYEDASFDGVVFCEVLEHLTRDPVAALAEIHRVLKPGGWLVLTTPNVARYENLVNLWMAHNIHDSYSAHGAYGRHNREYTFLELKILLETLGFDVERLEARDLHPGHHRFGWRDRIVRMLRPARYHEEGLFCRAVKQRPLNLSRPDWLYRLADKMPFPEYLLG